MCGQLSAKMDSGPEVFERFDITHYEPKESVCACAVEEFSLTSRVVILFLYFIIKWRDSFHCHNLKLTVFKGMAYNILLQLE